MKLSEKYSQVTILTSLVILFFTGIIYYLVIHFILTEKHNRDLEIEENEIKEYVRVYRKLPLPGIFKDQIVYYTAATGDVQRRFSDTEFYKKNNDDTEPGRQLVTKVELNGKTYQVTIIKSKVESEYLIRIIFLVTLAVSALLLITTMLVNKLVLSRLWKPFHAILFQLKSFQVAGNIELKTEESKIDEFRDLNSAAITLARRVRNDYRELKNFTDTASHEMMTPLAIINSKLDALLQTGPFSDIQGVLLEDIYTAIGRLSRLNQSILLLAKMENRMISNLGPVLLHELIPKKLRQFQELIEANGIQVELSLQNKEVSMNKHLADILLNNLISNAIRHNVAGGMIYITLDAEKIRIQNTGDPVMLNETLIFEKFHRGELSDGAGLGLALSRQICGYYGFKLVYSFARTHCFEVIF